MSDVIQAVSTPLKGKKSTTVFVIAGAVLGVGALLYKKGQSSSATNTVSTTEAAAGSPYPSDTTASVVGQSISSLVEVMQQNQTDLLGTLGDQNNAMLETITASNQQNAQAFQSLGESITDLGKSIVDSNANVYDLVHSISSSAPSSGAAPVSQNYQAPSEPAKPVVQVVAGSVEEQALKDMYGDRINITYAKENQYQGADRKETASRYMSEISRYGVTPEKGVDLDSYNDPYSGHVNG